MDDSLDHMPPTLDPSVLEDIRSWYPPDDPDPIPELAAAFVEDATVRLAALREAVLRGDATGAGQAAHSLKGMSGAIGAARMNALSLQCEQAGLGGGVDVGALVADIEREFARIQDALLVFVGTC